MITMIIRIIQESSNDPSDIENLDILNQYSHANSLLKYMVIATIVMVAKEWLLFGETA